MVLGIHTFAVAPLWDIEVMRAQAGRLKSHGVGLLEIPLLRPEEIDIKASRAFAKEFGFKLVASLGLPANIDAVTDPETALAFLEQYAFRLNQNACSKSLFGRVFEPYKWYPLILKTL